MSVFLMFLLRLRSLNGLEQDARGSRDWMKWVGGKPPSADTVGYVFSRFDGEGLRGGLRSINRKLGRNKAFELGKVKGMAVVSLDGHELFSSTCRCCPHCSERRVKKGEEEIIQYYHRVVMAQMLGSDPRPILDMELQGKGDGELTAATRLIERLLRDYPRSFGIVTLDALYASGPLVKLLVKKGKHAVIVLKDEQRDLMEDARSLFARMEPEVITCGGKRQLLWDLEHFATWPQTGTTVRVVRSVEEQTVRKQVAGKWKVKEVISEWWWVTTLPKDQFSARVISEIGHWRWEIENQGAGELVSHWNMDHCFKHDPVAIEAFLLTLAWAYSLFHAFVARNLNHLLRRRYSLIAIARSFYKNLDRTPDEQPWQWAPG